MKLHKYRHDPCHEGHYTPTWQDTLITQKDLTDAGAMVISLQSGNCPADMDVTGRIHHEMIHHWWIDMGDGVLDLYGSDRPCRWLENMSK